jgi:hypothetical protein
MTTKASIEQEYERGEIDYLAAIEALQEHCGISSREAESIVEQWQDRYKHNE